LGLLGDVRDCGDALMGLEWGVSIGLLKMLGKKRGFYQPLKDKLCGCFFDAKLKAVVPIVQ